MDKIVEDGEMIRNSKKYIITVITLIVLVPQIFLAAGILIPYTMGMEYTNYGLLILFIVYTLLMVFFIIMPSILSSRFAKKAPLLLADNMFQVTYSYHCNDDYVYLDENRGKVAFITKGNPFKIQVFRVSAIENIVMNPGQYAKKDMTYVIKIHMLVSKKPFYLYCYNGQRGKQIVYIKLQSPKAIQYIKTAQDLIDAINRMKNVF